MFNSWVCPACPFTFFSLFGSAKLCSVFYNVKILKKHAVLVNYRYFFYIIMKNKQYLWAY